MPYKGALMSIREMLDELAQHRGSELPAFAELSRALEERAIILHFNGEPLREEYVPGIAEYIRLAADRNAREIRLRLGWAADIMLEARALRVQFESACELSEPSKRLTAEEACRALIVRLREGSRLTKAATHAKAKAEIPDLIEKQFDRAWEAEAPAEWRTGGRPKKLH
jgi:hypothetical protein